MTPIDPPYPQYLVFEEDGSILIRENTPPEYIRELQEWIIDFLDAEQEWEEMREF